MELSNNISGIVTYLAEKGKIKLGEAGADGKGNIKYLDFMRIKKNYKVNGNFVMDDEVHAVYGEKDDKSKIKKIKIKFPFNDIDLILTSYYALREGNALIGKGDNKKFYLKNKNTGVWEEIPRPDKQLEDDYTGKDKWSLNLYFNCKIVGFETVGSVYMMRGKSHNNYKSLRAALERIRDLTKGQLMELEFQLSVCRARNSKGSHAQLFLDYLGSELDMMRKSLEVKKMFAELEFNQSEYEQKLKERMSKDFELDQFGEDEDIDKEFNNITEHDDISDLDDTPPETLPNAEEPSGIPDLTLPEEKKDSEKTETLSKIAKMRVDAIAKVNEADTIEKLETLKKGIGYKDDFGKFKPEADAVIVDVLDIINKKITELTPAKPEIKSDPHEQLKNELIKLGLDHELLRQQFYKNFGASESYLKDLKLLAENVAKFKDAKINGKKAGLITKINEKLAELKSIHNEEIYKALEDTYREIKKDDFAGLWKFWLNLTE
jgi:hypothetical protein